MAITASTTHLRRREYVLNNINLIFKRALDYEQDFLTLQYKLAISHNTLNYRKLTNANKTYIKGYMSACWQHHITHITYIKPNILQEHDIYSGSWVYIKSNAPFIKSYPCTAMEVFQFA